MTDRQEPEYGNRPSGNRLPRHYWPLFLGATLLVAVLAAAIAASIGLNPYVAAAVAGGFWVLRETWLLKNKGY
jgi:hypothetical protein